MRWLGAEVPISRFGRHTENVFNPTLSAVPSTSATEAHVGPPSLAAPATLASNIPACFAMAARIIDCVIPRSGTLARRSQQLPVCPARRPEFSGARITSRHAQVVSLRRPAAVLVVVGYNRRYRASADRERNRRNRTRSNHPASGAALCRSHCTGERRCRHPTASLQR